MDNSDQTNTQQDGDDTNWEYKSEPSIGQDYDEGTTTPSLGVPLQQIPPVSWSASEYVAHEKSPGWYLALFGAGTVLVLAMYVLTRDVLASIVVLFACVVIGVFAGRKPDTKQYTVDEQGVHIDNTPHPYREFRSFSIIEEGAIDCIWLKPLKRFAPIVALYFSPEDEEKIVDMLSNFLPHEQRELDTIDKISKRMRF